MTCVAVRLAREFEMTSATKLCKLDLQEFAGKKLKVALYNQVLSVPNTAKYSRYNSLIFCFAGTFFKKCLPGETKKGPEK